MYQILDQGKNFFEPQQPRRPVREHVPLWLRWALIFFILTNIGSFIATTVITVMNIDGIIEKLVSKGQLSHEDLRRVKVMIGDDLLMVFVLFYLGFLPTISTLSS